VQIGAVPDLASHPIGPMLRAGFDVSVNTDNRLMSDVMPSSELTAVATTFELNDAEVAQLVHTGIMAGFAPLDLRRRLARMVPV
jgi:adenosine deaminase